jgi:hypothetical protein
MQDTKVTVGKRQLAAARLAVGFPGADLIVNGADGVEKFRVGFLPGIHHVDLLKAEMAADDTVSYDGASVTILRREGRLVVQRHEQHADTGAKQDFQPNYSEDEARLRQEIKNFNRFAKRLDQRQAALEGLAQTLAAAATAEPARAAEETGREDPVLDTGEPPAEPVEGE